MMGWTSLTNIYSGVLTVLLFVTLQMQRAHELRAFDISTEKQLPERYEKIATAVFRGTTMQHLVHTFL